MKECIEFLLENGFEVQNTSFERQIRNENLKEIGSLNLPDNDAAKILVHYPEFFIYDKSKSSTPNKSAYYLSFLHHGEKRVEILRIWQKYFPSEFIVVEKIGNSTVCSVIESIEEKVEYHEFFKKLFLIK